MNEVNLDLRKLLMSKDYDHFSVLFKIKIGDRNIVEFADSLEEIISLYDIASKDNDCKYIIMSYLDPDKNKRLTDRKVYKKILYSVVDDDKNCYFNIKPYRAELMGSKLSGSYNECKERIYKNPIDWK